MKGKSSSLLCRQSVKRLDSLQLIGHTLNSYVQGHGLMYRVFKGTIFYELHTNVMANMT